MKTLLKFTGEVVDPANFMRAYDEERHKSFANIGSEVRIPDAPYRISQLRMALDSVCESLVVGSANTDSVFNVISGSLKQLTDNRVLTPGEKLVMVYLKVGGC